MTSSAVRWICGLWLMIWAGGLMLAALYGG